jgi:hypothetical protein
MSVNQPLIMLAKKLEDQLVEFNNLCCYLSELDELIENTEDINMCEFNVLLAEDAIKSYDILTNSIFGTFDLYFKLEKELNVPINMDIRKAYNWFKRVRD